MQFYTEQNSEDLLKMVVGSDVNCYPHDHFAKIKKELCVHTQGKLYDKILTIFRNEEPETTKFVLQSYEPVTTASIKKGIDSLSRIFKNNGVNIITDADTYDFIINKDYSKEIIQKYIDTFASTDPNAVLIPYFDIEKKEWKIECAASSDIVKIEKDFIIFIDEKKSKFHYEKKSICTSNDIHFDKEVRELLKENVRVYDTKSYVFVSENQYITLEYQDNNYLVDITNLPKQIVPYSKLCPQKYGEVCESPVQGFVSYGNISLIQHRATRCVEMLYVYPRMSEVEIDCDTCHGNGKLPCENTSFEDNCFEDCKSCNGSGAKTMQSVFKIYKRKLNEDFKDFDPVKFHTPDVGILQHVQENWQKTLKLGENAIYVQQNSETGNVQSASAREKMYEEKYAWLDRIANAFYSGAETILNTISVLNNKGKITLEKPLSYSIMSEIESFEYLDLLVKSDTPALIKSTHIENFLKKYVSVNSPIIKAVNVLKKVDKFLFTTETYLEKLSNNAIIQDKDWIVHAYAYPLLSQMVANEPTLLSQDVEVVANLLNKELENYLPKNDLTGLIPADGTGGNALSQTVGGLQGVIEIAKAVASGLYDLDAGIKLISSLYEVSEETASQWLGTPQIESNSELNKVQTIL